MTPMEKQTVWRESASLIIAAKNNALLKEQKSAGDTNDCDYKLLLLKRSDRTAAFTDQCVFPGGHFDAADEAMDWLKYMEDFGVTQQQLKQLVIIDSERPRILAPQGNGCYDRFFKKNQMWAREISLRITAIRETFEEVGVLLCRSKQQLYQSLDHGCVRHNFDILHWQRLVHNDAREFLRLCRTLKVVPDLWGLYEWSAWASPAPVKKGYRMRFNKTSYSAVNGSFVLYQKFVLDGMSEKPTGPSGSISVIFTNNENKSSENLFSCLCDALERLVSYLELPCAETVFFMTFLSDMPTVLIEETEVKEYLWHSPSTLVKMYRQGQLCFLIPQNYEISRCRGVRLFDSLLKFTQQRSMKGTTLYLPVCYICNDGIVYVLPGDDYYLDDPRGAQSYILLDMTRQELRAKTKHLHRCENVVSPSTVIYMDSVDPPNGHLSPVNDLDSNCKL